MIDALRDRPHPTHMTIAQALEASKEVSPKKTYLTHLCHEISHATKETELPEGCYLAYDGLTVKMGA